MFPWGGVGARAPHWSAQPAPTRRGGGCLRAGAAAACAQDVAGRTSGAGAAGAGQGQGTATINPFICRPVYRSSGMCLELGYPGGYVSVAFRGTGSENVPAAAEPQSVGETRARAQTAPVRPGCHEAARTRRRGPCSRTEALLQLTRGARAELGAPGELFELRSCVTLRPGTAPPPPPCRAARATPPARCSAIARARFRRVRRGASAAARDSDGLSLALSVGGLKQPLVQNFQPSIPRTNHILEAPKAV